MTVLTADNVLFGHTDEDSALVVDDYPYGRTVRTQIRYWIETTKNGDRFCSQTLNPKTGVWNKPKKSTYSPVGVMYREDETGYVRWTGLSTWAKPEAIEAFLAVTRENLSEAQKRQVAVIIGLNKAYEGVTFSVVESGSLTAEQRAEMDREQAQAQRVINSRARSASADAMKELG